ncbi:MAG: 8-amino-7-oxononanoate synthase, partial [Bacteroides sp.]|nr:8-amino-7-oxononanoate synthase [Bacteroides sp.]
QISIDNFIASSSSSRLMTGNFPEYVELERLLSDSFGTESALIFNSGYHANTGIIPALADKNTLIIADKLIHASLIDGIRLSGSTYLRYKHNDIDQLERLISEHNDEYNKIIVATESIFSMDGDEANLSRLVDIKRRYSNVMLYVDEAHAVGVRGKKGLGCAEEQGVIGEIDCLVGTFGKALGSVGAYIVCKKEMRELLINKMRTFIFTTALPPINISWSIFAFKQAMQMSSERAHLKHISHLLKQLLEQKGYKNTSTSHIIPVVYGDSRTTMQKANELRDKGFYAVGVRPPTVPQGTSRLRISLNASITEEEIRQLANLI